MGWSSRNLGWASLLAVLFFAMFSNPTKAVQSIAVTWNVSTDTNIVGYRIYTGSVSRSYTNVLILGKVTNATISGLVEGTTYYFTATSYNTLGLESPFSSEISYTGAPALASVRIRSGTSRQIILTVTGKVGRVTSIQASQDLITWTIIGTVTLPASGSLDFIDANAASFPKRFYRTQQ
jgi:hypothetical protein